MDGLVTGLASSMVSCLGLGKGSRIMVFHDSGSRDLYRILATAAELIMATATGVDLDKLGRPLQGLPGILADHVRDERPDASFYIASTLKGELGFRKGLIEELARVKARHVHMPNATIEVLEASTNCMEVAGDALRLHRILEEARHVTIEAPGGTRLEAEVGGYRWVPDTGVIRPGDWGNWPPGEVYTTPDTIEGVLVVDGTIGRLPREVQRHLLEDPVTLEIIGGRIVGIEGRYSDMLQDLVSTAGECGLRIGELGIGCNKLIQKPIGIVLYDEKMPGAHIALGDPLPEKTGAKWSCSIHVDMIPLNATITVDGKTIVRDGRLAI